MAKIELCLYSNNYNNNNIDDDDDNCSSIEIVIVFKLLIMFITDMGLRSS